MSDLPKSREVLNRKQDVEHVEQFDEQDDKLEYIRNVNAQYGPNYLV